ncbi:SET domain-containing protein [Mytilinidion resinicola]|uniref:SET domain-containing protein n=1 Tax=Mytilinidion resinicola TaxID=574789 RepID=A0A6A6YZT6_9PEZI|nr:SET domain-containing protein [Mytilinidion resinicola]KAF2813999.1 SET domain-containing protein [Mytilinidion resinicola]
MILRFRVPSVLIALCLAASITACTIPSLAEAWPHLYSESPSGTCSGPPEIYTMLPTPKKGYGLFATRRIARGTTIILEAPLVIIQPPPLTPGQGYEISKMLDSLRAEFAKLSPLNQKRYLALHAHMFPSEEGKETLMPILRSNAFNTGTGLGLFPIVARINHSCRPNAAYFWSEGLGRRVVYAGRNIEEGEEISISYIPLLKTTKEREKRLIQYGFRCECKACEASRGGDSESDDVRAEMQIMMDQLEAEALVPPGEGLMAERKKQGLLEDSLRLVEMVEEEELVDYYAQVYKLAAIMHGRSGRWKEGAEWALRSLEIREMADEYSDEAMEMRRMAPRFILESKKYMGEGLC